MQEGLERVSLEFRWSSEGVIASLLSHLLCASGEDDGATSLLQEEALEDEEDEVGDELYPLDPSPANGEVDPAGVDWSSDGTEDLWVLEGSV